MEPLQTVVLTCSSALSCEARNGRWAGRNAQAFQVSDQAVRLWKEGWFQPQEALCGESKLRNPKVRCCLRLYNRVLSLK